MATTVANINQFFETYGWQYDFDEGSKTWNTGFRGDTSNFSIMVHLAEDWLYFSINPFVNAPVEPVCEKKLHYYLLRLNHAINMAKFSLDAEGDVTLTVELPTENMDYSQFSDGLNAVSFYADAHYLEILNTAQDPSYTSDFFAEDEAEDEAEADGQNDNREPN